MWVFDTHLTQSWPQYQNNKGETKSILLGIIKVCLPWKSCCSKTEYPTGVHQLSELKIHPRLQHLTSPELECGRQSLKCLPMHTVRASWAFFLLLSPFISFLERKQISLHLLLCIYLFFDSRNLYGFICLESHVFSTILSEMSHWIHLRHRPSGVGTSRFFAPNLTRHFWPCFPTFLLRRSSKK